MRRGPGVQETTGREGISSRDFQVNALVFAPLCASRYFVLSRPIPNTAPFGLHVTHDDSSRPERVSPDLPTRAEPLSGRKNRLWSKATSTKVHAAEKSPF